MAKRITDFFQKPHPEKQLKLNFEPNTVSQSSVPSAETSISAIHLNQNQNYDTCVPSSSNTIFVPNSCNINTEWYKGSKLDVNWLLQSFSILKKSEIRKTIWFTMFTLF